MNKKKDFLVRFDKFLLPWSSDQIKDFIIDELKRLSKETGYSISDLEINFYRDSADSKIAYFSSYKGKPIGFSFNLEKCNGRSANQILDICRHEFAHYALFMQKVGYTHSRPHNTAWKKMCKKLKATPSAFASNDVTRHIKINGNNKKRNIKTRR